MKIIIRFCTHLHPIPFVQLICNSLNKPKSLLLVQIPNSAKTQNSPFFSLKMEKLKLFLEELGKLFPEKSKFLREQLRIIEDEIKDLKKRHKKLEESIAFSKSDKTKVSYFVAFWDWAQKKNYEKVLRGRYHGCKSSGQLNFSPLENLLGLRITTLVGTGQGSLALPGNSKTGFSEPGDFQSGARPGTPGARNFSKSSPLLAKIPELRAGPTPDSNYLPNQIFILGQEGLLRESFSSWTKKYSI